MNWLPLLCESLPLILVASPAIGFVSTSIAARFDRNLVRPFGISNVLCTLVLLMGVCWQFEIESHSDAAARVLSDHDSNDVHAEVAAQEALDRKADRLRTERLSRAWFAVDGTNVWSVIVLIVVTSSLVWRSPSLSNNTHWFIPLAFSFEAASLAALTAYDLRAYLISLETTALIMAAILGLWGGPERRTVAGRFIFVQHCGLAFIAFGFTMLIVAVPWMKIEDSPVPPGYSFNVATMIFEIQKWMSSNQLANHYVGEFIPAALFLASLGFAILFGLFPFHSTTMTTLGQSAPTCAVLYLLGFSTAVWVGWLRFVVPVAPELLAGFGWFILIPSFGSAIWGSLRALAPGSASQSAASLFLSVSGLSLLGFYTFTRAGLCGAWLMQQQLTLAYALAVIVFERAIVGNGVAVSAILPAETRPSARSLLLMLGLFLIGFIASAFTIVWELFREDLLLTAGLIGVCALVIRSIYSLLNTYLAEQASNDRNAESNREQPVNGRVLIVLLLATVINLFPNIMFGLCEPEFSRIFKRYERVPSAASAQIDANLRQTSP